MDILGWIVTVLRPLVLVFVGCTLESLQKSANARKR